MDLDKTTVVPTLSTGDGRTIQARPGMTSTEVNDLRRHQRFDVTALVAGVGEGRSVTATCEVRDIMAIDQSADQGTKVQQAKFSFFYDKTATKSGAMIDILRTAEGSADFISFFGLNGKMVLGKDGEALSIETSNEFFGVATKGDRAESPSIVGGELHATPVEHREVLQQDLSTTRKDYTDV